MRSSKCVFSSAAALHRVFIAPVEQSHLQCLRRPTLIRPPPTSSTRLFHSSTIRAWQNDKTAEKAVRAPRDEEIKDWNILLVREGQGLSEPMSPQIVIDSLDRNTQTLVIVKQSHDGGPPICKIMDKKALRLSEKEKEKRERKTGGAGTKTLEINWAIDSHDLQHRLKQMKGFLEKGLYVEVFLAPKRGKKGRQATEEESTELVEKIREVMRQVEGAKETKVAEGRIFGSPEVRNEDGRIINTYTMFMQAQAKKKKKAGEVDEEQGGKSEKEMTKEEEVRERREKKRKRKWATDKPGEEQE